MSDLAFAGQVRAALRASSEPLTVTELVDRTMLSERLVRIGVGVLDALGELAQDRRHVPRRRGAMPTVYWLRSAE